MKTRFILFLLITFFGFNSINAQSNVDGYKYVIVPKKFDFLGEADKYRLNTLTKVLFEKYGFITVMEDEALPEDAMNNSCMALKSNVIKVRGTFSSKLQVELKNCRGDVLFTSRVGQSNDKKYQVAYTLALREAFQSFESLNYQYNEEEALVEIKSNTAEIEKLKEEIKTLKEKKEAITELPQEEKPVLTEVTATEIAKPLDVNKYQLQAKKVFNGFQLIDDTSKVVMTIYTSGVKDVFIVKGEDAIIYKKGEKWIYSEASDKDLLTKLIAIKF